MHVASGTIRELTMEELGHVSGGFSWEELAAAMVSGLIAGAMGASVTGAGVPAGALAGGLAAGAAYITRDLLLYYF